MPKVSYRLPGSDVTLHGYLDPCEDVEVLAVDARSLKLGRRVVVVALRPAVPGGDMQCSTLEAQDAAAFALEVLTYALNAGADMTKVVMPPNIRADVVKPGDKPAGKRRLDLG